jgi:glycosyltransferase involved in cell wall biosynthesis
VATRRLAIVASHPIQYQSVWFRALAVQPDLEIEVLFCHQSSSKEQAAAGFGVEFEWDVPLLEGYPHQFLRNIAARPTVATFGGLDTPGIKRVLRHGAYDAVLVLGWNHKSFWQAIGAAWTLRVPVMVRGDSHLQTQRSAWRRAMKRLPYRWFLSHVGACLAVGTWSEQYFLYYGVRPERIFRVPHVIDNRYFADQADCLVDRHSELRRRWGLDDSATVFLFTGKLIDKKRPLDFLRAIQLAAESDAPVKGFVVGDGPLRGECEDFVLLNTLPVTFAGFLNQSEIAQAYVASDALVLPSDSRETWGLVVNEAMACGLPCIVSDQVGCGPDLIVQHETGHTFPLGDIDYLGQLLTYYGKHRLELAEMGQAARRMAGGYTPAVAADGVLAALEAVGDKRT